MIQPQRIGRFLNVDARGYVEADVSIDQVDGTWTPLVDFVVRALTARQAVSSVYVRGSIPRGLAVEHVSDADFIYFSEINFDSADRELEKAVQVDFPFVNGLELLRLDRAAFGKTHHPKQRPYLQMLLKTQSLFLAGDDVVKDIEPFKIGSDMVSHVFSLSAEFSRLPRWLEEDREHGVEQATRQWFSRRILRAGFEVTMNRSGRFTRDLYLCYEEFSAFYPERSAQMYRVLVNCLNGEESPLQYRELVGFLAREGSRLLRQPS